MSKIRKNNSVRLVTKYSTVQNNDDINYKNNYKNLYRNLDDIIAPLNTDDDLQSNNANYFHEKISDVNLENMKLKKEITQLNKKSKIENEKAQEQINLIRDEKENLKIEFDKLIDEKNKIILSLNEEICDLKKHIEKLSNKNLQLLNNLKQMNEKLVDLKSEKHILIDKISDFHKSLNVKIKPKLIEHEDYLTNLQEQINTLQNDNDNYLSNDIYQKCIINNLKKEIQKLKTDKKTNTYYSNFNNTRDYNKQSFEDPNFSNILTVTKAHTRNNSKLKKDDIKENKSVRDIFTNDKAIKIFDSINSENVFNDVRNLKSKNNGNTIVANFNKKNNKCCFINNKKNKNNYRNILFDENRNGKDFIYKIKTNFNYKLNTSNKKNNGCKRHKTIDNYNIKEINFSISKSLLSSYNEDLINLDE